MTTVDPRLLRDTKGAEGCRLVAYRDTLGFWTIGYGHKLDQSVDWEGHEISQETADELLEQDLCTVLLQVASLPEWAALNDVRRNAVTELVFNMGYEHWEGFRHCRAALEAQNWPEAAYQLQASAWAREVGPRRCDRLAGYLLNGSYPT